jgi:hypothetical protein
VDGGAVSRVRTLTGFDLSNSHVDTAAGFFSSPHGLFAWRECKSMLRAPYWLFVAAHERPSRKKPPDRQGSVVELTSRIGALRASAYRRCPQAHAKSIPPVTPAGAGSWLRSLRGRQHTDAVSRRETGHLKTPQCCTVLQSNARRFGSDAVAATCAVEQTCRMLGHWRFGMQRRSLIHPPHGKDPQTPRRHEARTAHSCHQSA